MLTVRTMRASEDRWSYFRTTLDMDVAHDARADYYLAGGTPSRWLGAASAHLGLTVGAAVTEETFRHVIEEGADPFTGVQLGREYQKVVPLQERVAARITALPAELSADERAAAIASVETQEAAAGARGGVCGFEFVFNPPKSVSAIWAVADGATKTDLVAAHQAALEHTMRILERDYAKTRTGTNGVVRHSTSGVVAAAFDHWDTRAGDPQLHTHVTIANRVQGPDGRWRTLDSRDSLLPAAVTLSAAYDAALRTELSQRFGFEWTIQEIGADPKRYKNWRKKAGLVDDEVTRVEYAVRELGVEPKNLKFEVKGVPNTLIARWSQRVDQVDAAVDDRIAAYTVEYGRKPAAATILQWKALAALSTRPKKAAPVSLAAHTEQWRREAGMLVGDTATFVENLVEDGRSRLDDVGEWSMRDDDVVTENHLTHFTKNAIAQIATSRATFGRANAKASALRALFGTNFRSARDVDQVAERITDRVEAQGVRLTQPTGRSAPARFRTPDGSSAFEPTDHTLYATQEVWAAESALLQRAQTVNPKLVVGEAAGQLIRQPFQSGTRTVSLSDTQARAIEEIAASGRTLDVLVGPAGAGKTTALDRLAAAWTSQHGKGSVKGLAPSAVAAAVLADELNIKTENTAMYLTWKERGIVPKSAQIRQGDLVIVDEAGMSGTTALDKISAECASVGAKMMMVGDWAQLAAVDAGGAFGMVTRSLDHAPELVEARRFKADWEQDASIRLRLGDTDALATYLANGRVEHGLEDTMLDTALGAWCRDIDAGLDSLLIGRNNNQVTRLNAAAQHWRLTRGELDVVHALIADDQVAHVGDLIVTRRNDRTLKAGDAWVRNGATWTVENVSKTGDLAVVDDDGNRVKLPARYAQEHVQLGYAATVNRSQGRTVDTSHTLVDASMGRAGLYVAVTRGKASNHMYVATDPDEILEGAFTTSQQSYTEVLAGVLAQNGEEISAHETVQAEFERLNGFSQLAAEYDSIAAAAWESRAKQVVSDSGHKLAEWAASPAWVSFVNTLREVSAIDPDLIEQAFNERELASAEDPVKVMTWRLKAQLTAAQSAPTYRRIAGLVAPVAHTGDVETDPALREREIALQVRAELTLDTAIGNQEPWTTDLGQPMTGRETDWRREAVTIAAYRDKWNVTGATPVGNAALTPAQRADRELAAAALQRARLAAGQEPHTATRADPSPRPAIVDQAQRIRPGR